MLRTPFPPSTVLRQTSTSLHLGRALSMTSRRHSGEGKAGIAESMFCVRGARHGTWNMYVDVAASVTV